MCYIVCSIFVILITVYQCDTMFFAVIYNVFFNLPFTFFSYNREITVFDLAIPDTYCSPDNKPGHHCPKGMKCISIDIPKNNRGFNGFDELRKIACFYLTH